jgi:acetolactate synthase-1/2/3 large subunit
MGIIQIIEQVRTKRPVTIWADSTKLSYWMRRYLTGAGAFRFPMGSGMIGWALSAGIGGAVASREMLEDMEHVVVIGDGGLLFTQSELSTVQALGVPLTILLIDNTSYGIIADYHVARYGQASTATDLPSTDWKSVAEAFEIDYLSAHTHDDLREMLRDVPARPRLIQLHISIGKPRIP